MSNIFERMAGKRERIPTPKMKEIATQRLERLDVSPEDIIKANKEDTRLPSTDDLRQIIKMFKPNLNSWRQDSEISLKTIRFICTQILADYERFESERKGRVWKTVRIKKGDK